MMIEDLKIDLIENNEFFGENDFEKFIETIIIEKFKLYKKMTNIIKISAFNFIKIIIFFK